MGSAARAQAPEQVILGVDPGLTRCGFGIVRMRADRRAEWVHHEVQGTGADEPLEQRILRIAQAADQLLERFAALRGDEATRPKNHGGPFAKLRERLNL